MPFSRVLTAVCCLLMLVCLTAAIFRQPIEPMDFTATMYSSVETALDTVEVVDTTEIIIDKRTFVCAGDIDLKVSEVGIVDFTCVNDGTKVSITTNPQDIFVTKTYRKELLGNSIELLEEEME